MSIPFPEHLLVAYKDLGEDGEVEAKFYQFLHTDATSADWHRFAIGVNWDFHDPAVFEWIVSQPECDKATALLFFWKCSPEYELKYPQASNAFSRDEYPLINLVRERWSQGAYKQSEFAFSFDDDLWDFNFVELDQRHGEKAEEILPVSMWVSLSGRRLDTDGMIDGIPLRFWPEDLH